MQDERMLRDQLTQKWSKFKAGGIAGHCLEARRFANAELCGILTCIEMYDGAARSTRGRQTPAPLGGSAPVASACAGGYDRSG